MAHRDRSRNLTKEQLATYFHMPITDVAKELGICATMLKKICRRNGIPRWPYRKVRSVDAMIASVEAALQKNPNDASNLSRELAALRSKRDQILKNPDKPIKQKSDSQRHLEAITDQETQLNQSLSSYVRPLNFGDACSMNKFTINSIVTPRQSLFSFLPALQQLSEQHFRELAEFSRATFLQASAQEFSSQLSELTAKIQIPLAATRNASPSSVPVPGMFEFRLPSPKELEAASTSSIKHHDFPTCQELIAASGACKRESELPHLQELLSTMQ